MGEHSYAKSGVLYVTFNQDCTCVAIGSQQGLHVYNVDTHKLCYRHAIGAVSIVEMLFCTSLLGFVGAGEQPALTPRKMTVLNTTASRVIQELTYPTSVLAVRMNRTRLVVVTSRHVHVYSMHNLACLRVIDTEESQQGCCALTGCHEPNLLALPSSSTTGTVRIYDLARDGGDVRSEVAAHQTPVTCMAWNRDGSLLATASAKGTLIRVHRMPGAARSHSFRRGAMAAAIQALAFGPPGLPAALLLAASSHGTIHVFRMEDAEPSGATSRPAAASASTAASAAASAAAGVLSAVMRFSVGDLVEPARNIATIRLPRSVGPVACAFRQGPPPGDGAATAATAATAAPRTSVPGTAELPPPPEGGAAAGAPSGAEGGAAAFGHALAADAPDRTDTAGGLGVGPAQAEEPKAVIMVATHEGLLYEYSLSDLLNPQGPKCNLEGEWSMLGSGSVVG